jgi:hypothetical protein
VSAKWLASCGREYSNCWSGIVLLGTALADDTNEVGLTGETKSRDKRKRKKKFRQAEVSEIDDSNVTLGDAEEHMKQLKVSDDQETDNLKTDSKSSKRKKMRSCTDKGPLMKTSMADSVDGEHVDEMETCTPLKKKKHRKKKKHLLDDHQDISAAESTTRDDHPEEATQFHDAEIVNVDEFVGSDQGSDAVVSQSEGEGASQEDTMDAQAVEDGDSEVVIPLTPLGRAETMARERKVVRRQLPQWITEAEIIADDITEQSRY